MGELNTFLLAMTPIGELRAALPVALVFYRLNWLWAYFLSVVGNLVPVVFLLAFLGSISTWLSNHFVFFKKFFSWLFEKTRKKTGSKMNKYNHWALAVFVAIPLPLTGAWTGALIAFLLGMHFWKAFLSISLGVLIAGIVVLGLTSTGIAIEKYFGLPTLIVLTIIAGLSWIIYRKFKSSK
jgi:uncharacterized membrane protein